jgi:two-component system KDP operon response regulator KdpE
MTFITTLDGTMTSDDAEAPARIESRAALVSSDPDLVSQVMSAISFGSLGVTLVPGHPLDPDTVIPATCDVILLDLDGHARRGQEVVARLRERVTAPILVLSSRDDEGSKVAALNAGASDYISVPFGPSEFLARIRAARRAWSPPRDMPFASYADALTRTLTLGGRSIVLTKTEWRVLQVLARRPGEVVAHARLLTEVWGPLAETRVHYLRVYMNKLRRKIEADPARPTHLLSVPKSGYVFRPPRG